MGALVKKILQFSLLLGLISCSTSSGFLDIAMPDRFGVGHSFVNGNMSSRITGNMVASESGSYDEDINAVWFEWDIPTINSDPRSSIADMRSRVVEDYSNFREPKEEDSLLSLTKHVEVDETTGKVSETWDFGVSSAIYSALTAFLTYLGFHFLRKRASESSEAEAE